MTASAKTSRRPRGRWRTRAVLTAVAGAGLATALVTGAAPAGAATAAVAPSPFFTPGGVYVGNSLVTAWTGSDHTVQVKDVANGTTFNAGGNVTNAIGLAPSGSDVLIFGQGVDGALWYKACTLAGSCSGWVSLGGKVTSRPGAVFQGPNVADYSVYARGTNGAVWYRTHTTAGWAGWKSLGGNLLIGTGPAAADLNGTYVLVVGTNQQLYLEGPGVTGFNPVGGQTTSDPGLAATAAPSGGQAALVGVARGTDGHGYYHRFLSNSPGWHSLGGTFNTGLVVANLAGTTTTTTFGVGSDNQVYAGTQSWATYPPKLFSWIRES
ncbi:MAG TPA: hypothetical protein VG268_13975 [Streptosporangiaceae bacterium]|jgi:hypothetical protein|nr:hypothetical protein [Streptosporangiaceae bacterium]